MNTSLQQYLERDKARELECPFRKHGQCLQVSESLGWKHGVPLQTCDQCWELGSSSEDAQKFRAHIVLGVIRRYTNPAQFGKLPPAIRQVLLEWHLSHDHGVALMEHPDAQAGLKHQDERQKVKKGWKEVTAALKSYKSRGLLNWKRAELTIHNQRHVSCFGTGLEGGSEEAPCRALRVASDGIHHYCGECGCGEREDAILDDPDYPKLAFPHLECPLRRKGFSNQKD